MKTKIAGISFIDQNIINKLQEGEILFLIRELGNVYDQNAVKIINKNGQKVGYVNRELAQDYSEAMDRGLMYYAQILQLSGADKGQIGCNIEIKRIGEERK